MRESADLEALITNVRDFRSALEELLAVMEKRGRGLSTYEWVPKQGQEDEARRRRQKVSELSGPAATAATKANVFMVLEDPPFLGGASRTVNALQSWASALEPPNKLEMEDVFDVCDQTIGGLDADGQRALRKERSLAGLVARFFRFPYDVREAVGLSRERSAAAKAAFGFGVIIQGVVVGVIVTLSVAGISKLFEG